MSEEPMLATVADLKVRLNARDGDSEDALLEQLLRSASQRIRNMSGRRFTPENADDDDPITKVSSAFDSKFCQAHDLRNLELITADGVDVTGQVRLIRLDDDDPAHAIRLPCAADQVSITGWFGFADVPESIQDAVLGWAQRAYHEVRSRMADSHVDHEGLVTNYFRSVPVFVSQPVHAYTPPGL